MKTIKVKLDNKTVEIEKLPIGKFVDVLKALREIPKKLSVYGATTPEQTFEVLPAILADSLPEAIKVLEIATPLNESELQALGIDEFMRLIIGVYEVNNFQEVFNQVKKATAQAKATQ